MAGRRARREYLEVARAPASAWSSCAARSATLYEFVIGLHDCMLMMLDDPDLMDE